MIGDRLTVGIMTPHAAPGPEIELPAMTRGRVTTVVYRTQSPPEASHQPSRIVPAHAELRASTGRTAVDRAMTAFGGTTLSAVAHASTTSGYLMGHRAEAALIERLSRRFDVPAVASCAAVVAALRLHGIGHVQLVHPPWFDDEFDALGAAYFRSQGFDALVTKAVGLFDHPTQVHPQRVLDWVEHHVDERVGAVFLAGNGFRASEAIEELEARTGRFILEANQALLWRIMTATRTVWDVTGHGRLLRASTPNVERSTHSGP